MGERRRIVLLSLVVCACTEPNPFVGTDTGTQGGTESGNADTTVVDPTSVDSAPDDSGNATDDASVSTTVDPTASSTGEVECQLGTHVCVAAAPSGWSGPVALVDDAPEDAEPGCAEPFATASTVAYDDLVAPPAACACECGNPSSVDCDITLLRDNNAGCATREGEWPLALTCITTPSGAANQYWRAISDPITGNCSEELGEEIVDAEFGARHTVCAASEADAGTCADGEVCTAIPIAPFTADALCIWAEGDLECPPDLDYDTRRLMFREFTDDRACSTCQCSIAGECTGTVYLFNDGCDSQLAAGTLVIDGGCVQFVSAVEEADIASNFDIDASCEPSGGAPIGAAEGSEPVTVCCRG